MKEQRKKQKNIENDTANSKPKMEKIGQSDLVEFIEDLKEIFKNRKKREKLQSMAKKDIFAVSLTIIIIIALGIILWFIPFTNKWMRELLFENPIFNAIGALFSK